MCLGLPALATGQMQNMGLLWPLGTFCNRGHQVWAGQGPQGAAPCPGYLPQLSLAIFTLVNQKHTKSGTGCPMSPRGSSLPSLLLQLAGL